MKKNKTLLLSFTLALFLLNCNMILAQDEPDENQNGGVDGNGTPDGYASSYVILTGNSTNPTITTYATWAAAMQSLTFSTNNNASGYTGHNYEVTTYSNTINLNNTSNGTFSPTALDGSKINTSIKIEAIDDVEIPYFHSSVIGVRKATLVPIGITLETMPMVELEKIILKYNNDPLNVQLQLTAQTVFEGNMDNIMSGIDMSAAVENFNTWLYGIVISNLTDLYPDITINNYDFELNPTTSEVVPDPNRIKKVFYKDNDGDGFGNPDIKIQSYEPLNGYVTDNTDCNDNKNDPTNDCSPCTTIKEMLQNTGYNNRLAAFKATNPYSQDLETGYQELRHENQARFNDLIADGYTSLTFPINTYTVGTVHVHNKPTAIADDPTNRKRYPIKIYSPTDIIQLINNVRFSNRNPNISGSEVYSTLITSNGEYVLKYTGDPSLVGKYNHFHNEYKKNSLREAFRLKIRNTTNETKLIEKLFKFIEKEMNIPILGIENSDLSLYKINDDGTITRMKVYANGKLYSNLPNCN